MLPSGRSSSIRSFVGSAIPRVVRCVQAEAESGVRNAAGTHEGPNLSKTEGEQFHFKRRLGQLRLDNSRIQAFNLRPEPSDGG